MNAGGQPHTSKPRSAKSSLCVLPADIRKQIWLHFVPEQKKIVQAARRKFPQNKDPSAPPEYTLTVRDSSHDSNVPKLPIILHICRESRGFLPLLFRHAVTDNKMRGIWWNREVDVLYLDYDICPDPEKFFENIPNDCTWVRHLAVGLKLGADFVYRLDLDNTLHTVSGTPIARGDLGKIMSFLRNPRTLSIVYPKLPNFWLPSRDQCLPPDIEDELRRTGALTLPHDPSYLRGDIAHHMITIFNVWDPETALEVLLLLKGAQAELFRDRLFAALLGGFVQEKRKEYTKIKSGYSEYWGMRRIEDLMYPLTSLRGPSLQTLYVTPLMRFDDGPPTAWIGALNEYLARTGGPMIEEEEP